MKKNLLNKKRKSKAFTLVELIIVIAIIAILAAVAIPKFLTIKENSNVKADIASAKNIKTVVESKIAEDKIIPGSSGISFSLNDASGYGKDVADELQGGAVTCKAKEAKGKTFKIYVDSNFNVTVKAAADSEIEILPTPSAPYN